MSSVLPPVEGDTSRPERRSRRRELEADRAIERSRRSLTAMVLGALLGCLGLYAALHWLATVPDLDAEWQVRDHERIVLVGSSDPALAPAIGHTLVALEAGGRQVDIDQSLLLATPRWTIPLEERAKLVDQRREARELLALPEVVAVFAEGDRRVVRPVARGWFAADVSFWLLGSAALMLHLVACMALASRPRLHVALFAGLATCVALQLLWLAVDRSRCLAAAPVWLADDLPGRLGLDLAGAAAGLHALLLYPVRHASRRWLAPAVWSVALAVWFGAVSDHGHGQGWWLGQLGIAAAGVAAAVVLSTALRREPNPMGLVLRRLVLLLVLAVLPLTLLVAVADDPPRPRHDLIAVAVIAWTLFLATAVAWLPFIARGRGPMRELVLLSGLSSMITTLHLLMVAGPGVHPPVSFALSLAVTIPGYIAVRRWLLRQLAGRDALSNLRLFEQLYRTTREAREQRQQASRLIGRLLHEVFEPQQIQRLPPVTGRSRISDDGSTLVVPVATGLADATQSGLLLRFAQHGQRLFTPDDARLCDRILEQIRRAVAYDLAVERGRAEERGRIAQDLHDDIGARLLTLMYKAPTPEVEDYLRHTLKDLKTLTRGLAADAHTLAGAAAEWKADLTQRLTAAGIALDWRLEIDEDATLGVVPWSALTRVLRELVSNVIAHAKASRVEVTIALAGPRLVLVVADDGVGRDPQTWSHGLGLGGVRKRVKQLGGEVRWREKPDRGITCEVVVPDLGQPRPGEG